MKAVFGIGNPGSQYEFTRHNIGFIVLDKFALEHGLNFKPGKGDYYFAKGKLEGENFVLIKPTTYVNRSGLAASDVLNRFGIASKDFLVVTDDVNLDVGKLRIRTNGGDGGHNGLYSLIYELETQDFPRLRFGVGNNFEKGMMAEYVLSPFPEKEWEAIRDSIKTSAKLIEVFVKEGLTGMLNYFSKISAAKSNSKRAEKE